VNAVVLSYLPGHSAEDAEPALAAFLLLKWIMATVLPFRDRRDYPQEYVGDKIYRLPLPVCENCRSKLRPRRAKEWLRRVPVYEQLLDKFPNAVVRLTNQ
jgi:hypothetical protein